MFWFTILSLIPLYSNASELDINKWLNRPGVRMLAVEFYASWCTPCKKAIPRWRELHERYKHQGLRFIVVATRDTNSTCVNPGWNPDHIICDDEGFIADRFGATNLPAGFLWSWQGELLANRTHVEDIEQKIVEWMRQTPRIEIEAGYVANTSSITESSLVHQIRNEFKRADKIIVVATETERAQLRQIIQDSLKVTADHNLACEVGREITSNSLLTASVTDRGQLQLQMLSAEKGCLVASSNTIWNKLNPQTSIAEGVNELLGQLKLSKVQTPWIKTGKTPPAKLTSKIRPSAGESARAKALRRVQLTKDWQIVQETIKIKTIPKNERIIILEQFLSDYSTDNPHKELAEKYLMLLRLNREISTSSDINMVYISPGYFHMGCVPRDKYCDEDEKPRHRVYLDAYYIDKTEVTVAQYKQCIYAGNCKPMRDSRKCNYNQRDKHQHPVNCVDWYQAQNYCKFRGKQLPSEAQWERAARSKDGDIYPWGAHPPNESLVLFGQPSGSGTSEVESKNVANNGTYAMAGNVWEWVMDCYDKNLYKLRSDPRNPVHIPTTCSSTRRVLRGGSYRVNAKLLRSSNRLRVKPSIQGARIGFRCVKAIQRK